MIFKIVVGLSLLAQCLCGVPWVGAPRDANWLHTHEKLVNLTVNHKTDEQIVFLGDSITAGWAGNGKDVWKKYYTSRHAYNYGIGGDRTEHIIFRIENKEFDGLKPKVVVLKIGTNNLGSNTAPEIAIGIYEIIRQLEAKLPKTKILLLGVIPRDGQLEVKVQDINKITAKFDDKKRVFFLDMSSHFQTTPGKEVSDLYNPDKVHLTAKGYQVWQQVMEPLLKKLLD